VGCIELVLTTGLVGTILGTASRAQNVGPLSAVAIGGYIALAGMWASPISGASMNPARSFGPDLANGNFSNYWIYVVGPLAGETIAVAFAWLLRGPPDPGGRTAAQGTQDQPFAAGRRHQLRQLPGALRCGSFAQGSFRNTGAADWFGPSGRRVGDGEGFLLSQRALTMWR
jgi:hypothetical protein